MVRALKDNIDIITGRRGGRVVFPDFRELVVSPAAFAFISGSINGFSLNGLSLNGSLSVSSGGLSRADCLALNAYFNEWAKALKAFVERVEA